MDKRDDILERVAETLKEPVAIDPDLDRRVMAAIGGLPPTAVEPPTRPATWWSRRWIIRLSPLGGLAAAAVLAAVAVAAVSLLRREPSTDVPVAAAAAPSNVMQFVLVAPNAKTVTLVGDFNDWNLSATQLARQDEDGVWWVTVALPPGRYRYAFVVDGTNWRGDPGAPAAEDDFGRPNSVVTVGGV